MPAPAIGGNSATVEEAMALSTGTFAVRAWIYQPQPLVSFDAVMSLFYTPNLAYMLVGGDSNGMWVASESGNPDSVDYHSNLAVAQNVWTCVELDYVFTPGPPSVAVYIDDASVIASPVTAQMPVFDTVRLGVVRTDADGSTTIVDDVAMADQHIGCM